MVDPSHAQPNQSIPVVYFFNDSQQLKEAKVGDIICLRHFRFQLYQNFPQLTGNADKGSIFLFRNKWDFMSNGLYSLRIDPLAFIEREFSNNETDERMTDEVTEHTFKTLTADEWIIHAFGKASRLKFTTVDNNTSLAVQAMFVWLQHFFLTTRLIDHTIPTVACLYIQDVLKVLHRHNNTLIGYDALKPPGLATNHDLHQIPLKCDLVCLVVQVYEGNDYTPTSLLVWDGTSAGHLQTNELPKDTSMTIQETFNYSSAISQLLSFPSSSSSSSVPTFTVPTTSSTSSLLNPEEEKYKPENYQTILRKLEQSNSQELTRFLGAPLLIQGAPETITQNHYLAQFQPGSWVRIQNLYLNGGPSIVNPVDGTAINPIRAVIRPDTHFGKLEPYFA
jgi:hypothetical protein